MSNNPPKSTSILDQALFSKPQGEGSRLDNLLSGNLQQETDISDIYNPAKKNYTEFGDYDQFITPEADQESIRSSYQGTGAEIANGLGRAALNVIPSIVGNTASILDFEDYNNVDKEVGNDITRWVESLKAETKEAFPIYGENQLKTLDIGQSEWWTSNGSSLAESAASFAATGGGIGYGLKGVQFLSKLAGAGATVQKAIQGVGGISTAIALNQAEAMTSAIQVYDGIIKNGGDAQTAADAAAYTININRLNLPLNITSSLAFIRPSQLTRQMIKQAGIKSALSKVGSEGAQEFGEEIINRVAEEEGKRYGKVGKEYNYNLDNTISDVFSKEGLEAGLLGFIGGVAQTGATEAVNHFTGANKENNGLYQKQQASLKEIENITGTNIKNTLDDVAKQARILNNLNDAQANNDEISSDVFKNSLLVNQATSAFENGTTEQLDDLYQSIAETPEEEGKVKYGEDYKKNAIQARSQIQELEKEWNKTMQVIPEGYDKKALFTNKLEQKFINDKINNLNREALKLNAEVESIKQNSEEGVKIPQEVELQTINSQVVKLQSLLKDSQLRGIEYLKPSVTKPEIKKTVEDKVKEFRETPVVTSTEVEQSEPVEAPTENIYSDTEALMSEPELVTIDAPNVDFSFDDENDSITDVIKKAHDLFLPKKKAGTLEKYVKDEEWRNINERNKATSRFSKLLQKKGFDPKQFNIATVEQLFEDEGQSEYFDQNRDAINRMVSAIGLYSGTLAPLSFDANIPPTQEGEVAEEVIEDKGLKRTTSLNGRYKYIKTDENGYSLRELNGVKNKAGDIQFENNNQTPYYDILHTNKVQVDQELELVVDNPTIEGDLDSLHIKAIDKVTQEFRFYVSTLESVNDFSLDLSPEELEVERNKIKAIREFFSTNRYAKLNTKIASIGTGKLEFNGNFKSISKIPDVHKYLGVKKNGQLVGQNLQKWKNNFPKPSWFADIAEGSVILTLPEADHKGSYYSRPVTLKVNTFDTSRNPSPELKQIREEVKKELQSYLDTGKYSNNLENWVYVQSSKLDPAKLGKNGVQLKDKKIIFNGQSISAEQLDTLLDQLRINVKVEQLANTNSDYTTKLINSGVLQSAIAYKQVGNETIFAFHPTIIYTNPFEIQQEENVSKLEDEVKTIAEETGIDIDLDLDNLAFDIDITPNTQLNINPEFSLNQEDKIIDSFAYEVVQGKSKEQLKEALKKTKQAIDSITDPSKQEAAAKKSKIFADTLSSFDDYYKKAEQLLESLDFSRDEEGFYNEFIDADNALDQMMEEAGFLENRVDSIPKNVRRFLMYIPAYDKEGKPKRNALGLLSFNPIDDTYLKIAQYLSTEDYDNTRASFNKMVGLLQDHPNPVIKKVAENLQSVNNEQLQNQFYRAFNQQIVDSRTILITPKDNGMTARIKRADNSSAYFQIRNEWYLDFNSKLVTNDVVNTEKGKELNNKFKALLEPSNYNKNELTPEAKFTLVNLLKETGINISIQGLNSWLQNDSNFDLSKQRLDKEHLKATLRFVFERLAGESKQSVVSEDEDVITKNNPFENEAKHIESLAYHESGFSSVQGGSSFRHDGKQYSSYVRHMPLETQLNFMKSIKDKLVELPVFKYSYYAQKLNDISFIVERGLKITKKGSKPKNLKDANEKEHEVIKLLAFQKDGYFKSDTLSDKTTNVFFNTPLVNVSYKQNGQLSDDVRFHLQRYFKMEYDRIRAVQSRMDSTDKLDGFDSTPDRKGAGEYFLTYDFLNYEVLGDSPEESLLKKYMYDEDGRLMDLSQYPSDINSAINNAINKLIVARVNKIKERIKQDWKDLGVWETTPEGTKINDIYTKYKEQVVKKLVDANLKVSEDNVLELAATDYTINYMTQTIEMLWLYGDPALQSKIKYPKGKNTLNGEELIAGIKKTFENVGKRNASLMAQSEGGSFEDPTYKVVFINDIGVNSNNLEDYNKDFREAYQDLKNEKMTDAQEFTIVQEHLEDRLAFGEISKNLFYLGVMHFDPQVYNSAKFTKKYPDKTESKALTDAQIDSLNGILQPRKPVQVFNTFTPEGLQIKYYIKTSSVPLVPSVVKGKPMEKILQKMKAEGVQRIAFNSGVKIGLGNSESLFNDGEVNDKLFKIGVHTLERKGYGIQLNVPYHEDKDAIRQVTQAMKLLFVDLDDNLKLSNGMTVKEARDKYRDIEAKLVSNSKETLNKELGANAGIITNMEKLSEILVDEGNGRGYTQNALAGLKTNKGKFKIPLTYSPNIGQIQPVLTSLVNNRVVRQKIKGKSYVQVSEILTYKPKGFEALSEDQKDSITWIKPEYKSQSKLNFISKDGDTVKAAQILVPSFFIVDGKKIKLPLTEDGYLDTTKIDPNLLEMHGFRIPNQAHSSMMHFEVVGFLPEGMGDAVVVPSEIAIQMGSDYDVDKLYAYNYEFDVVDGNLVKKDSLVNQLIDIHKAVILSPKLFDTVTKPQGFEDLADAISEVSKALPQDNEWLGSYNPIYQRKEFFDNAAGKTGVGIASNHNTQHALSQRANLFIKGQGILFKKEDGSYFNEKVEENRVNEYKSELYTYALGKDTYYNMEDRNDSAWRLDKKYTYSGKLISQVIAEWQGASVDNAKEKLLGTGGINDYNLSVSLTIARAGFDNEWILNFINQPILKEYYKTIDNLQSIFYDSFESDRRGRAIEELYKKYGVADYNLFLKQPFEGYTLNEYKEMLGNSDKGFDEKQTNVLKAFLEYEKIALHLATLQGATSVDVKGLPKNYVETVELNNKQSKLDYLGLGNTNKFYDTVIGGFMSIPQYAVDLFSEVFDYNTNAYNNVINTLKFNQTVEDFTSEQLNKIYNNLYSFIYTLPEIQKAVADGKELETYKRSLVLGDNTLSDRLQTLKNTYSDNLLLSRISRVLDQTNLAKRLQLDSTFSKSESYDKELTAAWLDMIRSNQKDQELKQFGLDLAAYSMYFNNEPYGISNFMKYIPIEYFEAIGFGDKLQDVHSQLNDKDFLDNFTQQYYQHNVSEIKSASFIDKLTTAKKVKQKNKIVEFSLPKDLAGSLVLATDELGNKTYSPYVKLYNSSTSDYDLFKLADNDAYDLIYKTIDQLGQNSFNEYNFNNSNQTSLLEENKAGVVVEVPKEVITKKPINYKDYFTFDNKEIVDSTLLLKSTLEKAVRSNNKEFSTLAEELLNVNIAHEVSYTKLRSAVLAETDSKTMSFDIEKFKNKSDYEIQRTILHEFVHAVTLEKLYTPEFQQTKEYKNLESVWSTWKSNLSQEELAEAKDFKERYEAFVAGNKSAFEELKDFQSTKSKYYAYTKLDEFVTQVMTDKDFQSRLSTIQGKETNLWSRFVKAIKDIIKSATGSSLLDEAIEATINVIKVGNKVAVSTSAYDLGVTVGELMKEMTTEQRAKFRELRESGIFTTKC